MKKRFVGTFFERFARFRVQPMYLHPLAICWLLLHQSHNNYYQRIKSLERGENFAWSFQVKFPTQRHNDSLIPKCAVMCRSQLITKSSKLLALVKQIPNRSIAHTRKLKHKQYSVWPRQTIFHIYILCFINMKPLTNINIRIKYCMFRICIEMSIEMYFWPI